MNKNRKIIDQKFTQTKGGIIIKDDVWIGANSAILDGVIIEEGAVVGSHSLVRGTLESYTIYAESMLKIIGQRT